MARKEKPDCNSGASNTTSEKLTSTPMRPPATKVMPCMRFQVWHLLCSTPGTAESRFRFMFRS